MLCVARLIAIIGSSESAAFHTSRRCLPKQCSPACRMQHKLNAYRRSTNNPHAKFESVTAPVAGGAPKKSVLSMLRRSQDDGGDAAESSVNLRGDIRNVAQEESSAAKPAEEAGFPLQHSTSACTAASVAAEATNTQPATMQELQELQAWLATCTEDMLRENRPLKRLKTAVAVCTLPATAERRDGVQKLAGPQEWDVKQKERGVKRNAEQLHRALVEKVVRD